MISFKKSDQKGLSYKPTGESKLLDIHFSRILRDHSCERAHSRTRMFGVLVEKDGVHLVLIEDSNCTRSVPQQSSGKTAYDNIYGQISPVQKSRTLV